MFGQVIDLHTLGLDWGTIISVIVIPVVAHVWTKLGNMATQLEIAQQRIAFLEKRMDLGDTQFFTRPPRRGKAE